MTTHSYLRDQNASLIFFNSQVLKCRRRVLLYASLIKTGLTLAVHLQDMKRMYSAAKGKGANFLEAPVSGSKVRDGTGPH